MTMAEAEKGDPAGILDPRDKPDAGKARPPTHRGRGSASGLPMEPPSIHCPKAHREKHTTPDYAVSPEEHDRRYSQEKRPITRRSIG
jgi:hypothetical protein